MSESFIRFAFTGGVFSESLLGRNDVEKFDLGLAAGENWFIHYQGGASTRPGFFFLDYVQDDDLPVRLAEFKFSARLADVYLLVFSKDRLRFMQNGAYVLEAAKTITAIASGVFTVTGHGFAVGDWVKITGANGSGTYEVSAAATNTFELINPDGTAFAPTFAGSMTVSRIYTVASPFATDDLADLVFSQTQNEITITHLDYPPYRLTRTAATSWTLAAINFDGNTDAPTGTSTNPQTSGTAGVIYGVTAVDSTGAESYIETFVVEEATNNFTTTAGSVKVTWTAVSGAKYYNVYRSVVCPDADQATVAQELGFIGRTQAPHFIDANIVPDFTSPPPIQNNPFAPGRILSIDVTAGGTGYNKATSTVSITGGSGSGFVGKPIVNGAGAIIGVLIINAGSNYSSPVVSFGGGSGATATATAGALTGTFPRCSTLLQQRRIYAGTDSQPMTLFGSRPGLLDNFSASFYGSDADAFELSLDAPDVNPIRFCVAFPSGLLAFTESTVYLMKGAEGKVLSPLSSISEPISGTGIAEIPPLYLEDEVLYLNSKGTEVRLLRPEAYGNQAKTQNISLYSTDFFSKGNIVESWAFAKDPYRLLWAQRLDGTFLSLTYLPDQNVFAWSNHSTQGQVRQVLALNERGRDRVYAVISRKIGGVWRKYIERLALREPENVERMMAVDSALQTTFNNPNATLSLTTTTASASAAVFSSGDVGSHLRAAKGRAIITGFTDSQNVTIAWQIAPKEYIPQSTDFYDYEAGEWSLDAPFTTISNLHHLEGKTVQIFADGNVQEEQVVSGGAVTLALPASFATVGLSFTARLKTLPLHASDVVIGEKPKRVVGAALRLLDSRGIFVGDDTTLYEMKDRTNEAFDEPTRFQNGLKEIAIATTWDYDGSLTVEKRGPLNATVLGIILSSELGDA